MHRHCSVSISLVAACVLLASLCGCVHATVWWAHDGNTRSSYKDSVTSAALECGMTVWHNHADSIPSLQPGTVCTLAVTSTLSQPPSRVQTTFYGSKHAHSAFWRATPGPSQRPVFDTTVAVAAPTTTAASAWSLQVTFPDSREATAGLRSQGYGWLRVSAEGVAPLWIRYTVVGAGVAVEGQRRRLGGSSDTTFTVTDQINGTFAIVPEQVHMSTSNTGNAWKPGAITTVELHGKDAKQLVLSGTAHWKLYENRVTNFVSQGDMSYFSCNRRGCNTSQPLALKLDPPAPPSSVTLW